MNLLGKVVFLFFVLYFVHGIVDSAPRGGGGGRGGGVSGGGGSKGNSSGGKRSGYFLYGGLYPVSRAAKEAPIIKTPIQRGIGAWGIIGVVFGVLALCLGIYYALYLCDLNQRTRSANYSSNLAAQNPLSLLTDKPKPEENGNDNIPMSDKNQESKNDLSKGSTGKSGLNEVFL